MRTLTVAQAKARLSALLSQVEAGEEIVITRHGQAIARLVPEPASTPDMSLAEWFAFVDQQPMHDGPSAGEVLARLRRDARY
ncbi:MAG: type II toxin-antitoxin system prevent-host-death family antitoxin [Rhodocyclaceae bacterium]|nr:type II toxin-antitoxin system prevent-host-death family antitoxin [Rhodocyclaceae bacterium]